MLEKWIGATDAARMFGRYDRYFICIYYNLRKANKDTCNFKKVGNKLYVNIATIEAPEYEYSFEEIGKILNISEDTARTIYRRAMEKLQKICNEIEVVEVADVVASDYK
ncbi:MAG: hypothetical protein RL154_1550 [Pseudomonadota bacterium]|jgi:hypothetical protein